MKALKIFLLAFLFVSGFFQNSHSQGLYSPPDNASVTTPFQFVWYKMPDAIQYQLKLYINFTLVYYIETQDSVYTMASGSGTYTWLVTYVTNSGNISTTPRTIHISQGVPQPPVLYSPPNGTSVSNPVTFIWFKSAGAASYYIQISMDNSFIIIIYDASTNDSTISTSLLPTGIPLYWRVKAIGPSGASLWSSIWHFYVLYTSVRRDIDIIPISFKLYDSYPNPFNPSTTVRIDIPKECNGKFIVYNALGEVIETLLEEHLKPGIYHITVSNDKLSSGIYFYRFISESFSDTKKMILLK
jgi:hypothetical protein